MGDGMLSLSWNNHKATFCHILSTLREKVCGRNQSSVLTNTLDYKNLIISVLFLFV